MSHPKNKHGNFVDPIPACAGMTTFSVENTRVCDIILVSTGVLLMGCNDPFDSVGISSNGAFAPFFCITTINTPDRKGQEGCKILNMQHNSIKLSLTSWPSE